MKVSDCIVSFLIEKKITDVFGYPGGSVTNLMESFRKRENEISAHVVYNEQAAAFAACGYAVSSGKVGVAYATGGPGATNMITAIGHAYFDSIPIICFTGNVNLYEMHGKMPIRQKGFQELDILPLVKEVTKACMRVECANDIRYCLEKAYSIATSGRKGPVLIDLPMNILREEIDESNLKSYRDENSKVSKKIPVDSIEKWILEAKRPCFLLGNGIKSANEQVRVNELINKIRIPYVTSMIAFDVIPHNDLYYGFVGAYGNRVANFVAEKSDLIISIGSRMDIRQVGVYREKFAPNAKIIRVDIDEGELEYKVHNDELSVCADLSEVLDVLANCKFSASYHEWLCVCEQIKNSLKGMDNLPANECLEKIGDMLPEGISITTDVGQNQVWVAQSLRIKKNQIALFSGGMGAMGHALPSAIGAYYGRRKPVICICGDGGIQMNIQELQFVYRENLPIKIVVINNKSLGMIRQFQDVYFDGVCYQTNEDGGYSVPDFVKVAKAYGIDGCTSFSLDNMEIVNEKLNNDNPELIEIILNDDTYISPKLEFGKPNYDQMPLISRDLLRELLDL